MRIAIVCINSKGGSSKVAHILAKNLNKFYNTTLIKIYKDNNDYLFDNIMHISNIKSNESIITSYDYEYIIKLKSLLQKYDIVNFHYPIPFIDIQDKNYFNTYHGSDLFSFFDIGHISTVSNYANSIIKKNKVIYNFLTIDKKYNKKENICTMIGKFDNNKRMLETIIKIENFINFYDFKLHIFGDGCKLVEIKNYMKNNKNIIFHGYVNDISDILSKSKFYFINSKFESFSLSSLEAAYLNNYVVNLSNLQSLNEILLSDDLVEFKNIKNYLSNDKYDNHHIYHDKYNQQYITNQYINWFLSNTINHNNRMNF